MTRKISSSNKSNNNGIAVLYFEVQVMNNNSDSDGSSLADYLLGGKRREEGAATTTRKRSSPPRITFTGSSSRQPMTLDSDDDSDNSQSSNSDASSILEVLPPKQPKMMMVVTTAPPPVKKPPAAAAAAAAKPNKPPTALVGDNASDSDADSLLQYSPGFGGASSKKSSSSKPLLLQSNTNSNNKKKNECHTNGKQKAAPTTQQTDQTTTPTNKTKKARNQAERKALQERKTRDKQAAMETRKRQRLEHQARRGHFATTEVVLLCDPALFRRPIDPPPLHQHQHQECYYDWREHDEIKTHNLMVQEYRSALVGSSSGGHVHVLQWIRQDHLKGGASEAWKQLRQNNPLGYTHVNDRLVVVMDDPKIFIRMLHRTPQQDVDDDYPALREWLLRLEHSWNAAWPLAATSAATSSSNSSSSRPKLLLLLHRPMQELDRQWVDFRKKYKNSTAHMAALSPPSAEEFHDALTWILIQYQVECMCCDSYEEIWTAALKMTRAIAKAPYHRAISELECVQRIKPRIQVVAGVDAGATTNSSGSSSTTNHLEVAQDVWFRQLQQIPGVSETMARSLVMHYPTIQSLWQAYNNHNHRKEGEEEEEEEEEADDPELLLAGCLSDNRQMLKLSRTIYKLLTSTNPEELPMR